MEEGEMNEIEGKCRHEVRRRMERKCDVREMAGRRGAQAEKQRKRQG
jgi:hypothetical protein